MSPRYTTRSTVNSDVKKKSPVTGHLFVALTSISKSRVTTSLSIWSTIVSVYIH